MKTICGRGAKLIKHDQAILIFKTNKKKQQYCQALCSYNLTTIITTINKKKTIKKKRDVREETVVSRIDCPYHYAND